MENYDNQASYYDNLHENEQKIKYSLTLRRIAPYITDAELCLDCGCGTGLLIKELQNLPLSFVGLDISTAMLRETSHKIQDNRLNLVRGDSNTLPLVDEVFDIVFAFTLLDGEVNWLETLRELYRVCSPQGIIVTSMLRVCPLTSQYKDTVVRFGQKIMDIIDIHGLNEIIFISRKGD